MRKICPYLQFLLVMLYLAVYGERIVYFVVDLVTEIEWIIDNFTLFR